MANENLNVGIMYHFTNRESWKKMNEGNHDCFYEDQRTGELVDGEQIRGLWPSRRLIDIGPYSGLVPPEATKPTVFGLPEEKPSSWIQYNDTTNVFDDLMRCCAKWDHEDRERRLVLLRVDLKQEDNPFVVDYSQVRSTERDFTAEPKLQRQIILPEMNRRYWGSRVPLADYKGNFALPEIVVWAPIPLERVHFVWEKELHQFLDEALPLPERKYR